MEGHEEIVEYLLDQEEIDLDQGVCTYPHPAAVNVTLSTERRGHVSYHIEIHPGKMTNIF